MKLWKELMWRGAMYIGVFTFGLFLISLYVGLYWDALLSLLLFIGFQYLSYHSHNNFTQEDDRINETNRKEEKNVV